MNIYENLPRAKHCVSPRDTALNKIATFLLQGIYILVRSGQLTDNFDGDQYYEDYWTMTE